MSLQSSRVEVAGSTVCGADRFLVKQLLASIPFRKGYKKAYELLVEVVLLQESITSSTMKSFLSQ